MKKPQVILAVVGLVVAGAVAWYVQRPSNEGLASAGGAASAGEPGRSPGGAGARGPGDGSKGGGAGGPGPGGPGGPVTVEVGKATAARLEDDASAVGTVRARRTVVLRPEVSGRVAALGFVDGARVRKGQLLVQLDDTLPAAQLKQAEAQSSIARTNLQRSRELAAQNFVSQSAVDQNAAALEVAMAQVALAQAQVSRMKIHAPFDAVAGIRVANVGDYLKDGADIVTLDDIGSVFLDFRLPERVVPRVAPGRAVEAQIDALPGRRFTGLVTALDSQIDANGRALLVRAELRNTEGMLRPGMFARARVVFGVRDNAVLVPEEALVPQGDQQFIYKVVSGPKGPIAQRLIAKVGLRVPGKVEITEGIAAGDTVVTAGHARLSRGDNQLLRVVDIDKLGGGRGPGGPGGAASGARGSSSGSAGAGPRASGAPVAAGAVPGNGGAGPKAAPAP